MHLHAALSRAAQTVEHATEIHPSSLSRLEREDGVSQPDAHWRRLSLRLRAGLSLPGPLSENIGDDVQEGRMVQGRTERLTKKSKDKTTKLRHGRRDEARSTKAEERRPKRTEVDKIIVERKPGTSAIMSPHRTFPFASD
eukprot:6228096-Prymnesium_polylepis.2